MKYEWVGSKKPLLDEFYLKSIGTVHVGCYGGSTSNGANKNEDGLFVISNDNESWVFAAILDAHHSAQSAEIIIDLLNENIEDIYRICNSENAFMDIEPYIVGLLSGENFKKKCEFTTGETSCLLCFQSGSYLWWFSIGDCMAFLFHPDLAKFDQYGLNQRQFYEWIGQANTFDLHVPCYSSGRRQLRLGSNYILLMTDGVLEYKNGFYQSSQNLYQALVNDNPIPENLSEILKMLKTDLVRDSATLICWEFMNSQQGLLPSDL